MAGPNDRILYGMQAIADALEIDRRRLYYLKDRYGMPTFKMKHGRTICAHEGRIRAWFAEQEAAEQEAAAQRLPSGAQ